MGVLEGLIEVWEGLAGIVDSDRKAPTLFDHMSLKVLLLCAFLGVFVAEELSPLDGSSMLCSRAVPEASAPAVAAGMEGGMVSCLAGLGNSAPEEFER